MIFPEHYVDAFTIQLKLWARCIIQTWIVESHFEDEVILNGQFKKSLYVENSKVFASKNLHCQFCRWHQSLQKIRIRISPTWEKAFRVIKKVTYESQSSELFCCAQLLDLHSSRLNCHLSNPTACEIELQHDSCVEHVGTPDLPEVSECSRAPPSERGGVHLVFPFKIFR